MKPILLASLLQVLFVATAVASSSSRPAENQIRISAVIHDDNLSDWSTLRGPGSANVTEVEKNKVSAITLESMTVPVGKQGELWSYRSYPYIASYVPVQSSDLKFENGEKSYPVPPVMPNEYATENVGWTLSMKPTLAGRFVQLSGHSLYIEPTVHTNIYGENPAPNSLSLQNESTGKFQTVPVKAIPALTDDAAFLKSTSSFVLFAKPGQAYEVKLPCGAGWVEATIKCELL